MKQSIKDRLIQGGYTFKPKPEKKPMPENQGITLTQDQFQQLLDAIGSPKMNPLEQKKYDEEAKKDKRRAMLAVELGKAEAESRYRKQVGCSHSRDPRTGNAVARGMGEWTTGGQCHGDDTITLSCLRCGTQWTWKGSPQEREYANNAGLLGFAPPPIDRCINKADFMPPEAPSQEKIESLSA